MNEKTNEKGMNTTLIDLFYNRWDKQFANAEALMCFSNRLKNKL